MKKLPRRRRNGNYEYTERSVSCKKRQRRTAFYDVGLRLIHGKKNVLIFVNCGCRKQTLKLQTRELKTRESAFFDNDCNKKTD